MYSHCFRDYCPFNSIASKVQTQETTIKEFYFKESKVKNLKLALPYAAKPLEQGKKDKKKQEKEVLRKKNRRTKPQQPPSTPWTFSPKRPKRGKIMTLTKSHITIIIKNPIMPAIISNQKTSFNFGNFCVGN